ncbi:unnamed protein product [Closterium sp. NIES-64]|nr:unnamed protein product [Closterium sp. NIES-64]
MAHAVQSALSLHPEWVVLELDVANAFNSFSRSAMFNALRDSPFSSLIPFFRLFYASPSSLHYRSGPLIETLQSSSGVRQGDPCGPFLFALTQHLAIRPIQRQSPALFISSYADDTYMVGPAHDVFPAYTALTARLNDLGLRVQPSKCSLWAPLDLPSDLTPPSDIIIAPNGLTTASRLLTLCISARPSFLLRTVAPFPEVEELYTDWDNTLLDHFVRLIGSDYWPPAFDHTATAHRQPFLPIRLGGFGLRSSAATASLSYLCSWAQTVSLLSSCFTIHGSPIFRPFIASDTMDRLDPCIPTAMSKLHPSIRQHFPTWPALHAGYPQKLYSYLSQHLEAVMLERVRSTKQQAAGVGQICTEAWRRGVLRRVRSSKYIRRLLAEGETSMANISAGIDAVCARSKDVEATILNCSTSSATSACAEWPEECWPVPHMPFSSLTDFMRQRYLVFAMSEEQLSNARSHLVEAALLARMTNRTLVLPKASRSHVSLGRDLPVCEYWDLAHLETACNWVSSQFFLLLARAALANPSVGFMWVESPYLERHVFHYDMVTEFLGQLMPFTGGHVPLEGNTMQLTMPADHHKVAALLHEWSEKDIVVWFKTTWERVEFSSTNADDTAFPLLPYSRHHHHTAARLLALLPRPLIAVHFRSEFIAFRVVRAGELGQEVQDDMQAQGQRANASMVQERLEWCVGEAEKLITRVRNVLSHPSAAAHPASALAALAAEAAAPADVPFNTSAAPARSDSWQSMVAWYQGDNAVLLSSLAALQRLRRNVASTVMVDELMPHVNTLDPGGLLAALAHAQARVQ